MRQSARNTEEAATPQSSMYAEAAAREYLRRAGREYLRRAERAEARLAAVSEARAALESLRFAPPEMHDYWLARIDAALATADAPAHEG